MIPQYAIKAGVAEVDITPLMGVEMCGYGPYQKRVCTDVLDPLYARALWLESNEDSILIISVDLCAMDIGTRDEVAKDVHKMCGIDKKNILIAASHTHSGPAVEPMTAWGENDQDYVASLPGLLVKAAAAARDSSVPAKIGFCRQRVNNVGVNREQDVGPIDTAAQLMRIDRMDGTPFAVIFNFGAHCAARYPFTTRISADWPGLVGAYIKIALPGTVALFLQGPCGNVNAFEMTFDRTDISTQQKICDMRTGDMAKRFGDQILPALRRIETKPSAKLAAVWKTIELSCVPPDAGELRKLIDANIATADSMTHDALRPLYERILDETPEEIAWQEARFKVDAARHQLELIEHPPYQVAAPLQVIRIGEAVIVGWPGEIFVELGLELRQRSPFPLTFVASFANHVVGYIPTPAAYESKGRPHEFGHYPRCTTPMIYGTLPFRSDAGTIMVDETLHLLEEL